MAFNMDPKKCPMPTQDPNVRNKNFEEVALGYTAEMAVNEAMARSRMFRPEEARAKEKLHTCRLTGGIRNA